MRLDQLHENAIRALGMEKSHPLLVGIEVGFFVNQRDPPGLEAIQFCPNVVHFKSDMVNTLPPFLNELGDLTLGRGGLEEFQVGPLKGYEREDQFSETLLVRYGHGEGFMKKGPCLLQIVYGQPYMADLFYHEYTPPQQ